MGAFFGYVLADLLFGRSLPLSAFFAGTNLVGALTATALLLRLDERDLSLRRVHSVLRILAALLPACFAAALSGSLLVTVHFNGSALQAMKTWPASELVNYLIVLPAMLTLPHPRHLDLRRSWAISSVREIFPALSLALSSAAAVLFDGPGSIIFPMPAMLLCALTYSTSTTAVLTMLLGAGCLISIGLGVVDIGQDMSVPELVVSVRIAVAFLVLVPLTISSAMAVRDELLNQLRKAADHDELTGLLNRRAFERRMKEWLAEGPGPGTGYAVLWLDIDHFKAINDRHGHLAGDAVLQAFAKVARSCCREDDLIGRWGGEEFALVVQVSGRRTAGAVAARLRENFAAHVTLWNEVPIRATISIGACYLEQASSEVQSLIGELDEALYRAKRKGRDRVEWLPSRLEPAYSLAAGAQSALLIPNPRRAGNHTCARVDRYHL